MSRLFHLSCRVRGAPTETGIRLFVTLARFDAAFHGLFKCRVRALDDHPELSAHARRFRALPGIAATVDQEHIRCGNYSIRTLDPSGSVPADPLEPFGSATPEHDEAGSSDDSSAFPSGAT